MASAVLHMMLVSAIITGLAFMVKINFISEIYERAEADKTLFGIVLKDNDYGQLVIATIGTVVIYFLSHMSAIMLYMLL